MGKQNDWPKLFQMRFPLGFPHFLRVVGPWHMLLRETVVVPFLEMSKTRMTKNRA